jgi:hypothetical protein
MEYEDRVWHTVLEEREVREDHRRHGWARGIMPDGKMIMMMMMMMNNKNGNVVS